MKMNKINLLLSITLLVTCLFSFSTSIYFLATVDKRDNEKVDFEPINDPSLTDSLKYFTIEQGDFESYYTWDSELVFIQNPYKTLKIKTSNLETGVTFNKNDIIGNDGLNDIKADDDGFVLSKVINENEIILDIYFFNKYETVFKISNGEYYEYDFKSLESPFMKSDNLKIGLNFSYFDFSKIDIDGFIYVHFKPDDNKYILSNQLVIESFSVKETYKNVYYLLKSNFSYKSETRNFFYNNKGIINDLILQCDSIIENCAIIKGINSLLTKGMIIYERTIS